VRVQARDRGQSGISVVAVLQFAVLLVAPPAIAGVGFDPTWLQFGLAFCGGIVLASSGQLILRVYYASRTEPEVFLTLTDSRIEVDGRTLISIDLQRPHRARLIGDEHESTIQISTGDTEIVIELPEHRRAMFQVRFPDARYVMVGRPLPGIELDVHDPEHASFIDAVLARIWANRKWNRRFEVFQIFPWSAGESRRLETNDEVELVLVNEHRERLAEVRETISCWLDDRVGVSDRFVWLAQEAPQEGVWLLPHRMITVTRVAGVPLRVRIAGRAGSEAELAIEVDFDSKRVNSDHIECLVQFVRCQHN
jgi:hypothetical protein